MGVQLDQQELEEFLTNSHTMILSTLRKFGEPFMTPLWYVYMDGAIYFSTPSRSSKVARLKRDPRACCLIEEGDHWIDLKAVVINGTAEFLEQDGDEAERYRRLSTSKYADFRPQMKKAPDATKKHYYRGSTLIKLKPNSQEIRSWYNRKIRGFE